MTTLKNNEYIVFQPDQVLTNAHLNQLFHYLDRQNRLTRTKLIGMGIVCGFELEVILSQSSISSIKIHKGCGITSQGYLISDCNDRDYCYAVPYIPPSFPPDLPFCCDNKTGNEMKDRNHGNCNVPFYNNNPNLPNYCANIYKLVTRDQYKTIVENPAAPRPDTPPCPPAVVIPTPPGETRPGSTDPSLPVPLSSKDWTGYAVVLFLEAKEKDLKNCDMQDCNNKGEKIVFHIRPLLVPVRCLQNNCGEKNVDSRPPEIRLKRFDVATNNPINDITTGPAIVKTFGNIFNGLSPTSVLSDIGNAYTFCYARYRKYLPPGSNSFSGLAGSLGAMLTQVQNTFLIQYFYDYINDLILAYCEFKKVASEINIQCCADECAFPLHLVLGIATRSTSDFVKDCYRTYFIYTPLFDEDNKSITRLRFYYHRMEILVAGFANGIFPIPKVDDKNTIKIIPSEYEQFPLSQRAIPYYYPEDKNDPDSLYHYWNFEKTREGNDTYNQSYNAYLYSADQLTNDPLLYDIERYNFFRIEGHIGQPYTDVLTNLLTQRQQYNLPFNVVAVAAEKFFLTRFDIAGILCSIKDLLTEFESRAIEFLCKLILCTRRIALTEYSVKAVTKASGKIKETDVKETESINPEDFLKKFQFGSSEYKRGDFINFMQPKENTMGETYLNSMPNTQCDNPVDVNKLNRDNLELGQAYFAGFNVLYAADNLFSVLLNTNPQELDPSVLEAHYKYFDTQFNQLKAHITVTPATGARASVFPPAMLDDCCDCLLCLFLDLIWLLEQIVERLRQYALNMVFANYFPKHPGLEHKSGVPKGGTFVLVYSDVDLSPGPIIELKMSSTAINEKRNPKIIADFYIPYLCCSDCSSVTVSLPPADKPVFSIDNDKYLFDHAKDFPFRTVPPVTTTGAHVPFNDPSVVDNPNNLNLLTDANNVLYLHAAMPDLTETLPATLTYRDITLHLTIIKPDAAFTVTITPDPTGEGMLFQFEAVNQDGTSYEWSVNDQDNVLDTTSPNFPWKPAAINLSHKFPGTQDFFVTLDIEYVLNDHTSFDVKTAHLTAELIKQHSDGKPFRPPLKDEDATGMTNEESLPGSKSLKSESAKKSTKSKSAKKDKKNKK